MEETKERMLVSSIKNGTVLDHIASDKLFQVVGLLALDKLSSPVTIGNNLESTRHGKKGIIKISDRFFSDEELNRIALLAPEVYLNVIRDFKVVEKRPLTPPKEIIGLVRCPNPKCITNAEPMKTKFRLLTQGQSLLLECHYCFRQIGREQIELL